MSIDISTVRKYAPAFVFHPQEKYYPTSIEHLLTDAVLNYFDDSTKKWKKLANPTQQDLAEHYQQTNFIEINESRYGGLPLGEAPLYYSVQRFESFIEIHYLQLYAFKGSQAFKIMLNNGEELRFVGHNYGQHQGGLKRVTVRLVLIDEMGCKYKIFQVGFEKDGLMYFDTFDNVKTVSGADGSETHPVVHVGLSGHNCWNSVIRDQTVLRDGGPKCSAISCLGDEKPLWKPYEQDDSLFKRVGFHKEKDGYKPIEPEIWVNYQGRIGKDSKNVWINAPTTISGAEFSDDTKQLFEFMQSPEQAFDAFMTEMKTELPNGRAPAGLGARHFVYPDKNFSG